MCLFSEQGFDESINERRRDVARAALPLLPAAANPASAFAHTFPLDPLSCDGCRQRARPPEGPARCYVEAGEGPVRAEDAYSVAWAMATRACYLPMLAPGYRCHAVHALALRGPGSFQQLAALVRRSPHALSARDSAGNTALMLACAAHRQSLDVVRFLLRRGARGLVNAANGEGLTALHLALLNDRPDLVRLLLDKRADVDAGSVEVQGDRFGLTPLHVALVDPAATECFRMLLEEGADVSVQACQCKQCPLFSSSPTFRLECECGGCMSSGWYPCLRLRPSGLLAARSETPHTLGAALSLAVVTGSLPKVQMLLAPGAGRGRLDIDQEDGAGMSPLFRAAYLFNEPMIRCLVDHGADVNVHTACVVDYNMTPLHMLLSAKRGVGGTFRCFECRQVVVRSARDMAALCEPLLSSESLQVDRETASGHSPLDQAVLHGHDVSVRRLLERGARVTRACFLKTWHGPGDSHARHTILGLLLTAGLGHGLLTTPEERMTRRIVLRLDELLDAATVDRLVRAGAATRAHLDHMLRISERRVSFASDEERERTEVYRGQLRELLERCSTPRSLLHCCLIAASRSVGRGPPSWRAERLAALLALGPDAHVTWTTLLRPMFVALGLL